MAAAADKPIIALFISSSFTDALMAALLAPPTQCDTFGRNQLAEQARAAPAHALADRLRRALIVSGSRAAGRLYPCS
jgi:hypothetical protein